MMMKNNDVIRHFFQRGKTTIGVALLGVFLLSGCSLFDSPQKPEEVDHEAALQAMDRFISPTPEEAKNKGTEAGKAKVGDTKSKVGDTIDNVLEEGSSGEKPGGKPEKGEPAGWVAPQMKIERIRNTDMPQLAVWGLDTATFLVDDEQIELGKMTRAGRISLLGVGRHQLHVRCPSDPPFSADFYLVKGDRVVLRGRCSSDKRTVGSDGKRN